MQSKIKEKREAEYEAAYKIWNSDTKYDVLGPDAFAKYGIDSMEALERHLMKRSEYGGMIKNEFDGSILLLPFHHDVMNKWLKFDIPRVQEYYEQIYEKYTDRFHLKSKEDFKNRFFKIEEQIQIHRWELPLFDERILIYPILGCWDKVEIEAIYLESKGIEVKRVCCHDGIKMRGHTFLCFYEDGYWKTYMTSKVVLKSRTFEQLCKKSYELLRHVPIFLDSKKCELVEYTKPPVGCTGKQYIDILENGKVIIESLASRKN